MNTELDNFISFANFLSDESAKIIKKYFRKTLDIESKEDESPVTIADKNTELRIRELISKKFPHHHLSVIKLNAYYL